MIICYHKTRELFYVIRSNKREDRKFLFSSREVYDCVKYCASQGQEYKMAKSATNVLTHPAPPPGAKYSVEQFIPGAPGSVVPAARAPRPTRPTPPSDAESAGEAPTPRPRRRAVRHPSDEREEDKK